MSATVEPAIAFRVSTHDEPALEVRVNFGVFAGRYATPIVVPPCVAIVAAGKLRHEVVAVMGAIETHRVIPLSLTFDHRAATGGEAARFLKALLDDLALAK